MKAHFLLCQAQTALGDPEAALRSGVQAHALCISSAEIKSLPAITAAVLQCKKASWEAREKRRVREARALERELEDVLNREREDMLEEVESEVERKTIVEECESQLASLRDVFERSRAQDQKRREVPEWAIDDISFGILVDPVIVRPITVTPASRNLLTCSPDKNRKVLRARLHYGTPPPLRHRPSNTRTARGSGPAAESRAETGLRGVPREQRLGCRLVA